MSFGTVAAIRMLKRAYYSQQQQQPASSFGVPTLQDALASHRQWKAEYPKRSTGSAMRSLVRNISNNPGGLIGSLTGRQS